MTKPLIALVDAYSSGNYLPDEFARLGVDCIHVQSTPSWMRSMVLPDLEKYTGNIPFKSVEDTAERLRQMNVTAVLAGQEPGVPLADDLSTQLSLASNDASKSRAKRDKFEMIETARRANLLVADQAIGDVEIVTRWAEHRNQYPVVVKPLKSASTDNVFICQTLEEVRANATQILTASDIYGDDNKTVLIQSFLEGDEYIVDTVSANGARHIVGIWKYEKVSRDGKNLYNRDILIESNDEVVAHLTSYMDNVLRAFGIDWGATHTEIMMTPEGPALIEIGARLNGNMFPSMHNACLGTNQAALTALAYVRPLDFQEAYGGTTYTRLQPAFVYNTISDTAGLVTDIREDVVAAIRSLDSVTDMTVKVAKGGQLRKTVDLLTSPLRIFMTNSSQDALDRDYQKARDLQGSVYVTN